MKEARGNIYQEHQRFLQTFDPRWRADENIMLILSAITLFTPDRPHVVHHDVIKFEQVGALKKVLNSNVVLNTYNLQYNYMKTPPSVNFSRKFLLSFSA